MSPQFHPSNKVSPVEHALGNDVLLVDMCVYAFEEREKEDVEAANSVKPPDQRFKEIEKEIRKIQKEAHREIALRLSEKQKLLEDQRKSQGTQFFSTATVL